MQFEELIMMEIPNKIEDLLRNNPYKELSIEVLIDMGFLTCNLLRRKKSLNAVKNLEFILSEIYLRLREGL